MNPAGLMKSTITIASVTGRDSYGKALYGAQRTARARVEAMRRMVRKVNGDEAVASHRIYTCDQVLLTDRIWLPGANTASAEASNVPLAVAASSTPGGAYNLYETDL